MADHDVFSNPMAPPGHASHDSKNNLTNEDFRKLVMTVGRDPKAQSGVVAAVASAKEKKGSADADKKKKKKQQYLKFKKDKEEREKELSAKYRDRARERRDGVNQDYEEVELLQATADYRAVAPDAKRQEELKERRKKAIDESKYLGGDMQHTHLVKGLDYALLDKVKQEMNMKKRQEEVDLEQQRQQQKKQDEEISAINNIIARNIVRVVFGSANIHAERAAAIREHFAKQRMAYVVELDDEANVETDIPTTVMRSAADSGGSSGGANSGSNGQSSSEMVVEKLTEILAYLRSGKGRKIPKKNEPAPTVAQPSVSAVASQAKPSTSGSAAKSTAKPPAGDSIYDDVGDYVPPTTKSSKTGDQSSSKKAYFGKSDLKDEEEKQPKTVGEIMKGFKHEAFSGEGNDEDLAGQNTAAGARILKRLEQKSAVDSYAECYPGMMESMDAIADSDEEADLSKMDMGAKKGPLNRWDFETAEEFEKYKSSQEALPKAAFQYGVKTNEGRKTRREGKKEDKGALEREWKQIQQIWDKKREGGKNRDDGDRDDGEDSGKRPKY